MVNLRRGISPVIATVIIVAVTIAIAVAVVGWLTGLWSSIAGGTPSISLVPGNAYASKGAVNASVYIRNSGAGSDSLIKAILIYSSKMFRCSTVYYKQGNTITSVPLSSFTIPSNYKGWVNISCSVSGVSIATGDKLLLKIYFSKSGVQTITLVAYNTTS